MARPKTKPGHEHSRVISLRFSETEMLELAPKFEGCTMPKAVQLREILMRWARGLLVSPRAPVPQTEEVPPSAPAPAPAVSPVEDSGYISDEEAERLMPPPQAPNDPEEPTPNAPFQFPRPGGAK